MKLKHWHKTFAALVVVFAIVIGSTGCPKANATIREFRVKSAQLGSYGKNLSAAFNDAYRAGTIDRSQFAALRSGMRAFTKGLGLYREAIDAAEKTVKTGERPPRDVLETLERALNQHVVSTFGHIAQQVGLMSIGQSEKVEQIISGVRLLLTAIRSMIAQTRIDLGAAGGLYAGY